jgi:hypothetical protein
MSLLLDRLEQKIIEETPIEIILSRTGTARSASEDTSRDGLSKSEDQRLAAEISHTTPSGPSSHCFAAGRRKIERIPEGSYCFGRGWVEKGFEGDVVKERPTISTDGWPRVSIPETYTAAEWGHASRQFLLNWENFSQERRTAAELARECEKSYRGENFVHFIPWNNSDSSATVSRDGSVFQKVETKDCQNLTKKIIKFRYNKREPWQVYGIN